jgi:hypothetical protein
MISYMLQLSPGWGMVGPLLINVPMYCMELRHSLLKNLKFSIGEFGPVEAELIFGSILAFSGIKGV